MQQGVSSVGGSKNLPKTQKIASSEVVHRRVPSEGPAEPKETFQLGESKVASHETVGKNKSDPTPSVTPHTLAVEEPPSVKEAVAPSTISLVDNAEPEAARGFTFAELAKSASQAVGKTLRKLVGGDQLEKFQRDLSDINSLEEKAKALKTPADFAAKTADFKTRLENGADLEDIRNEAYAVAREAARQATGMRAYDCQMLGALSMNHGQIAEMRTGEGKTLTAVMPLYLNALAGKGAHLITVNETLAKRDSEWMGPIFERLGLKVGCVLEDQTPEEKRAGYNCDVTYLTDRTLGFDFLRDRTTRDPEKRVQRGHFFALVDEVDEVMIDEARTPMILSMQGEAASPDYKLFSGIVKHLKPGQDFEVDEQQQNVWLTEGGLRFVENEVVHLEAQRRLNEARPGSDQAKLAQQAVNKTQMLRHAIRRENEAWFAFDREDDKKPNILARAVGADGEWDRQKAEGLERTYEAAKSLREQLAKDAPTLNLYDLDNHHRVHYLDASLKAQVLQVKGKHYTVENGEVLIIDQNKGRVSQGKRFSNGLHQALEAKEGVEIRAESKTAASITLPELFNTYERKSGMTGTGKSSEGEFYHFYELPVVEIPTNKPVIRKDQPDLVFDTMDEKFDAVVEEAVKSAKAGRPVLVGTLSVNANKAIAARLVKEGWPADRLQVLNAETVRSSEDVFEPNAGRSGTITLATGDRADDLVPDPVNFKKMALMAEKSLSQGQGLVIDADDATQAEELQGWLGMLGDIAEVSLTDKPQSSAAKGQVVIRVGARGETEEGQARLDTRDYAVEKPRFLDVTADNLDQVVESALESYMEGEPVVLRSKSAHGLSGCAERLLDIGIGLESMPLVCEGKEKENLLVEMAGRSGFITVATNMAGRGANIKPDLVNIDAITEKAYNAAAQEKGVVIDLDKSSHATKIQRRLGLHCPVVIAEKPDQQPLPGQVLLRTGDDLPAVKEGTEHIKGSDFATGGLYVIGTERSNSRRIDDQLIGRAGRQGAEGESRFFLSMEDDLLRLAQSHRREPLEKVMTGSSGGVSNPQVVDLVRDIQNRAEAQRVDSRDNSDEYDEVIQRQREVFYNFREQFVVGGEIDGEKVDAREYMADFAAQGLSDELVERLGKRRKYSPEEISRATTQLGKTLGIPLEVQAKDDVKRRDLVNLIYPQVEKLVLESPISENDWKTAFLYTADQGWQEQLDDMSRLRDGIQWESLAGTEPEQAYIHRGYEAFGDMIGRVKRRLGTHALPVMVRRGRAQNTGS